MKQDMNGVRTAQDLEQKYNLSAIEEIKKETKINTEQITSTNNELKNFTTQITKDLGELQDQIDGNIMTWFLSGVPTLSTPPANEWTTDEDKISHLGDLYYDKETGYAYRFTLENDVYSWLKLTDSDIAEALAVANSAKDTADSKRRVFLVQPTPPYDNGDMWIKDKEIYICQISKAQGENFDARDFINDLKYTDDTYAIQVGNDLKVVSGTVLEIQNDVDEYSRTLTETQKLVNEQGEDIGILNTNYSNVNQTVEELTTKVSKIKNIEIEISGNNYVYLENTSANDLYKLSIKGDISLLFGNDGKTYGEPQFFNDDLYFSDNLKFTQGVPYAEILYPSNSLFGKNMNLVIEYASDNIEKVKLPFTYLNYISQEICDEFYLENGNAKIIRKVGINSSMQKYELSKEVIEDLGEFNIPLKEGNPKIYLQCFDSATYSATYMPKNAYTDEFATKVELNTAINQTSEQINLSVDTKIEDLDTKLSTDITQTSTSIINEVNASISNLDEDINAKLELKVDTENLISEINASAENVNINSNKLNLEGYTTINGGFIIDEEGNMSCNNATINGTVEGSIIKGSTIKGTSENSIELKIGTDVEDTTLPTSNSLEITRDNQRMLSFGTRYWTTEELVQLVIKSKAHFFTFQGYNQQEIVDAYEFRQRGGGFNDASLESMKKNFKKLDNALELINNGDIYCYNMKVEKDNHKKHIGLVIPDLGGDYKTPEEVKSDDGKAIDLYSMVSVCWKAIKEQQEIIENLKNKIEVLENEKNINS